jgi:hypothetical protein
MANPVSRSPAQLHVPKICRDEAGVGAERTHDVKLLLRVHICQVYPQHPAAMLELIQA